MTISETSARDEPPVPSAEAILFRVAMSHILASLPKADALHVLEGMAEDLANEQALESVLFLHPLPDQIAVNRARRQAIAAFRRNVPVWLQAIDHAD